MDFDGVYRSDGSAVVDPTPYDPSLDLLLGLYYYSLIASPHQTRYYHPLIAPYRTRRYGYLPTWEDVLYESYLDDALTNYENKLKSINRMETWKLEMEVQRLIDDLKRAKED